MDHSPAPIAPNTSNVAASSFAIKLPMVISRFYTAVLKLCGSMFSINPNIVGPSALTGATI
jgi:hypothetical protein